MSDIYDEAATVRCAHDALAHWDLDVADVAYVSARENVVFRVTTQDGARFALRIHRPGYHSLAELESENHWTTALSDAGVDTPRPVPTATGAAYATVPFGAGGGVRHVGLIEWIDGVSLEDALQDSRHDPVGLMEAVGALVGRMHAQAVAWTAPPGFVRHRLDADGLIGADPWWGSFWDLPEMSAVEAAAIDRGRWIVHARLAALAERPGTMSIIHADLLPANVLVHEGRPFAIDFDDAAIGFHLYDLAVALVAFDRRPDFDALTAAVVRGYRGVRELSDDDVALLPLVRLAREMQQIGWIHSRVHGPIALGGGETTTREQLLRPRITKVAAACAAL